MLELIANSNPFDSLVRFVERLAHPQQSDLDPIRKAITAGIERNFATESSGSGQPWQPLAPLTVKLRQEEGFPGSHPILQRSGEGKDSFSKGQYHIERIEYGPNGWTLVTGSSDPVMLLNAQGDGKRLPARPMGELSAAATQEVAQAVTEMIKSIQAETIA